MRATAPLCLLILLSGCATALRDPEHSILRPRPKILYINGTFEPVVFAVDHKRIASTARGREACQTNDPMPTGTFEQPLPQMPRSHPLTVAPMPNYCPVAAPLAGKTAITSTPSPVKTPAAPVPTEPQP